MSFGKCRSFRLGLNVSTPCVRDVMWWLWCWVMSSDQHDGVKMHLFSFFKPNLSPLLRVIVMPLATLLPTWINLIPEWISNCTHHKEWDENTCRLPNFIQRRSRWSLGMDKWFHLTLLGIRLFIHAGTKILAIYQTKRINDSISLFWAHDNLFMLGLKLIHKLGKLTEPRHGDLQEINRQMYVMATWVH